MFIKEKHLCEYMYHRSCWCGCAFLICVRNGTASLHSIPRRNSTLGFGSSMVPRSALRWTRFSRSCPWGIQPGQAVAPTVVDCVQALYTRLFHCLLHSQPSKTPELCNPIGKLQAAKTSARHPGQAVFGVELGDPKGADLHAGQGCEFYHEAVLQPVGQPVKVLHTTSQGTITSCVQRSVPRLRVQQHPARLWLGRRFGGSFWSRTCRHARQYLYICIERKILISYTSYNLLNAPGNKQVHIWKLVFNTQREK